MNSLPSAVKFAMLNLSRGKKLLVCCHHGEDVSICVCLAILSSLFDEGACTVADGKLIVSSKSCYGSFDGGTNVQNKNAHHPGLIPMDGCCTSKAAQLLNERWANAIHLCNDLSVDLSEKPVMYSGASGSSWGHLKLPHQMDFISELKRAMHNAQTNAVPTVNERS